MALLLTLMVAGVMPACVDPGAATLHGRLELTLLHTSDLHSRLVPYTWEIGQADARWGLGKLGDTALVGGWSRLAFAVARERRESQRSLLLDSGDALSGGIAFELFGGEPELRALGRMGLSAQALGNHEFDQGRAALVHMRNRHADFPALAANYLPEDLGGEARWFDGFTVLNAAGLRVGVVGVGNRSSLRELGERPNSLGLVPLEASAAVQRVIDWLRPNVDVVVLLSHLGLEADESLIQQTTGLDVVLGGHNHVVFDHARTILDCSGDADASGGQRNPERPPCEPRKVLLLHSGAYGRFLGRLDLAISDASEDQSSGSAATDGFEVIDHRFMAVPITSELPDHEPVATLLAPYERTMRRYGGLAGLVGYVPDALSHSYDAGESPLGNLAARALRQQWGARADFALINAGAVRSGVQAGPLTSDALHQAWPFDDAGVLYHLTGQELTELLAEVGAKTRARGCRAQLSVDGAALHFDCACAPAASCGVKLYIVRDDRVCGSDGECSSSSVCRATREGPRCWRSIEKEETVALATTRYFAESYGALRRRAPVEVGASLRGSVSDWIHTAEPCTESTACATELPAWLETHCAEAGCTGAATLELAAGLCHSLPCVDTSLGAVVDGRVSLGP